MRNAYGSCQKSEVRSQLFWGELGAPTGYQVFIDPAFTLALDSRLASGIIAKTFQLKRFSSPVATTKGSPVANSEDGVLRERATIRDVAGAAGVSIATVSLALSDNPSVAEATKERVRREAERLGYSPSAVGRALQARRTNAIGLVVPHSSEHVFTHLYFMEVMAGVSEVLNAAGMTLVLSTSPTETQDEAAYIK